MNSTLRRVPPTVGMRRRENTTPIRAVTMMDSSMSPAPGVLELRRDT